MKPKQQRLLFIVGALAIMAVAAGIILSVLRDNLMYFYTPGMLDAKRREEGFDATRPFRLGGLVQQGSVVSREADRLEFRVEDGSSSYLVHYRGLLPTLFREGQGVVLTGTLQANGSVKADVILAKHDENYMPPEVAEALRQSGHWGGKGSSYPTKNITGAP